MAFNTELIFNNVAYARIKSDITASGSSIELYPGHVIPLLPGWGPGKEFFLTLTNVSAAVEIVKVKGISGDILTVERGQDGSTARSWKSGSVLTQRLVAANLEAFIQKETFRVIDYNPNGILSADYPGEKVYQSGAESCQVRWWMNTSGTKWRLIAGEPCAWEIYDDEGYVQIPKEWIEVAPQYVDEETIYSLVVFGAVIFGGTSPGGRLLRWNGVDAWEQVAAKYGSSSAILTLTVLNDEIYGDGSGYLLKWNGVNAWTPVATAANGWVTSLVVLDGEIYGTTYDYGALLKWNGVDAWVQVAAPNLADSYVGPAVVLDGEIYAGTGQYANLFKWNGVDAWVQVASQYASESTISSLVVLDGEIYGGTYPGGKLLRWDGVDAWEQVADKYEGEGLISALVVLDGEIYGSTAGSGDDGGMLLKWNGVDAWEQAAASPENSNNVYSLAVYGDLIFGGAGWDGLLLMF